MSTQQLHFKSPATYPLPSSVLTPTVMVVDQTGSVCAWAGAARANRAATATRATTAAWRTGATRRDSAARRVFTGSATFPHSVNRIVNSRIERRTPLPFLSDGSP